MNAVDKAKGRSPLLATLGFSLGLTLVFTLVTYILLYYRVLKKFLDFLERAGQNFRK